MLYEATNKIYAATPGSGEGQIKDTMIAPLLLLPFLENAFKHGASEQIEKPWLGVDISVKNGTLHCKIVNSKIVFSAKNDSGRGISNVKKRLDFIYSGKHELRINDEADFFVASMQIKLYADTPAYFASKVPSIMAQTVPA